MSTTDDEDLDTLHDDVDIDPQATEIEISRQTARARAERERHYDKILFSPTSVDKPSRNTRIDAEFPDFSGLDVVLRLDPSHRTLAVQAAYKTAIRNKEFGIFYIVLGDRTAHQAFLDARSGAVHPHRPKAVLLSDEEVPKSPSVEWLIGAGLNKVIQVIEDVAVAKTTQPEKGHSGLTGLVLRGNGDHAKDVPAGDGPTHPSTGDIELESEAAPNYPSSADLSVDSPAEGSTKPITGDAPYGLTWLFQGMISAIRDTPYLRGKSQKFQRDATVFIMSLSGKEGRFNEYVAKKYHVINPFAMIWTKQMPQEASYDDHDADERARHKRDYRKHGGVTLACKHMIERMSKLGVLSTIGQGKTEAEKITAAIARLKEKGWFAATIEEYSASMVGLWKECAAYVDQQGAHVWFTEEVTPTTTVGKGSKGR